MAQCQKDIVFLHKVNDDDKDGDDGRRQKDLDIGNANSHSLRQQIFLSDQVISRKTEEFKIKMFRDIENDPYYQERREAALHEPFIDYLALTYHDRFLSKHIDIPNAHNVADKRDVTKMEFLIKKGLEGRVTPLMTPFNPDIYNPFISLLEMEEQQRSDLSTYVIQTLLNINEDIKFTQFRPSTLTASAIPVVCHKLYPWLRNQFKKKIVRSRYVQESSMQECFDEMKDHVLIDSVFGPNKCPREERHKNVPKRNNPLEFIIQDHEDFIDVFKAE
ncbi:hypothetical protein L2E82_25876 [Cichorium intybus]|uniref:Uncharacterized protein n=1 Tax=Cichorium intybus TaxID=13427 RepID=A0ACB9E4S5_CICIN|nr:hypothetical protein L2E82_25876 [Cichorium intybus]